jgi:hypothetical protein
MIFNASQLRRVLRAYIDYYNNDRSLWRKIRQIGVR